VTGRWKVIDWMRPIKCAATEGVSSSDRTLNSKVTGRTDGTVYHPDNRLSTDRTLAANRPDAEQQCPIEYREVLERRNCDRTRPVACDRTLAASDQLIVALTVRMTRGVWSGRDQRPVSNRKVGFHSQRLLS